MAVSLLVMAGMAAITLDGGNLYQERRSAQNAADQAAVAAAFTECDGGTTAEAIAAGELAATSNGYDGSHSGVIVAITRESQYRYRASVSTDVDATFGNVLGASGLGTSAEAVVSCTAGGGAGTTLHAHAPGSCPGTELLINGDYAEVNGGTHANGDISVTGDTVKMYDGTTYGGTWSASADDEDVDPAQQPGPDDTPYPINYDIDDYDADGDGYVSTLPGGHYHSHVGNTSFTDTVIAGVHFVDGDIAIHGGDEADPFTVTPFGSETGVTFVATGKITIFSDAIEIAHYSDPGNKGLLMFANEGGPDPCDDTTAIQSNADLPTYTGVLFAPNGRANILSDGASATAIWANFVNLTGNTENGGIQLSYPAAAVGGDPDLTFLE